MKELKYITVLLVIPLFISFNCSNPTQPPDKPPVVEPDSTTQNFTFQTYEFGDGGTSSWLNDVWIFNQNNIWAVGYITSDDTTNSTYHVGNPNILKWNGAKWIIQPYSGSSGGMYGIWAADSEDIYFAIGTVVKYDHGFYKEFNLGNIGFTNGQGIHKLWGSSESNIWGVGPQGTIVHYDGSKWAKIDFDQGWRFDAITGSEKTGIAYASATDQGFNTAIVELKDNSANIIYNSANTTEHLTGFNIRMISDSIFYLSDQQVWRYNFITNSAETIDQLSVGYFLPLIGVESKIDAYFFGSKYHQGDYMVHYNGKRLKEFPLFGRTGTIYGGAYAIKDLAIMVGESNNKAYLIEVKRR